MGLGPSHTVMFLLINPVNQLVLLTVALSHSTTGSRAFEVTCTGGNTLGGKQRLSNPKSSPSRCLLQGGPAVGL